ncbi:MAG: hypothetical protein QMD65_00780 [Patescibacteria group bacterium]|nr:hypothetical protein [Patescibacteria group bacterium]
MSGLFKSGQATLAFVLLVGGIVIEIAIAGAFVTYFLSTSGLGERLSARALTTAHAGVRDVQIKITRNKEWCSSVGCPYVYPIAVGNDSASVTVGWMSDDSDNYVYTIDSVGTASTRARRLIATLVVNRTTGLVQFSSLVETPIQ